MSKMLSVEELNLVLDQIRKIQDTEKIPIEDILQGDFSEVDIVFVAGLLLWHFQHKGDVEKIDYANLIIKKDGDGDRGFMHRYYFRQIEELYNVDCKKIFRNFPTSKYTKTYSYSRSFAPILRINKENLKLLFEEKRYSGIFETIKYEYINTLKNQDSNTIAKNYFNDKNSVTEHLENLPAINTFVFSVAYHKIDPFAKDKSFESAEDEVNKIWQFTQEYVSGLYELAKNIVEHSSEKQGMITLRAYSGHEEGGDKTKVLETHVFDFGKTGIIPQLGKDSKEKIKAGQKLSDSQEKINKCYEDDVRTLQEEGKERFTLSDFIKPEAGRILEQQRFRYISHYGINKLQKLVENKDILNGEIYVASYYTEGDDIKREYYHEEKARCNTINIGTSYYFEIPFVANNFKKIKLPDLKNARMNTLGTPESLRELLQKKIKSLSLGTELSKDDDFNGILDVKVEKSIAKGEFDKTIDDLSELYAKYSNRDAVTVTALNLKNEVHNESDLLRFLGYLSYAYPERSFVIYNVDYNTFIKMIEDNKAFAKSRESAFWDNGSILIFTKHSFKNKNENECEKTFYFADILYGETEETYYQLNKTLSNTFPNLTTILNKDEVNGLVDIIKEECLKYFFYQNALLPYDVLLKEEPKPEELKSKDTKPAEPKPLFLVNIETLLQNNLLGRKSLVDAGRDYLDNKEAVEAYINNIDGYHLADTHFKIGNKIHSSDFYYAKHLFQNSFYTVRLAIHLAIKIDQYIRQNSEYIQEPIILVGYEMYSELILSLVKNFLKMIYEYSSVEHFVAKGNDNGNGLTFLPEGTFKEYKSSDRNIERKIIIVVPIAATCSTAKKIKSEMRKEVGTNEQQPGNLCYNIILAQDESPEFASIRGDDDNQEAIIRLGAEWYHLKNCALCYGKGSKPLFDTDSSSLTPELIFGLPEGQKSLKEEIKKSTVLFKDLQFKDSIQYLSTERNNNYRIYDINTDIFINNNSENITGWLKYINKELNIKLTDNIVIVAPCHESNSLFINLINEHVFSSAATVIHHQGGVDFAENFTLMNKQYLGNENTRVFYVDDSLITGKHFFELFDLIQAATRKIKPITATIMLNDQSIPFTRERVAECSTKYFAFFSCNQPPTQNIYKEGLLKHEQKRYELLKIYSLHDSLINEFHAKVNKLNPQQDKDKASDVKQLFHLKMFEATHKIYDYFVSRKNIDRSINKIVNFELKLDINDDTIIPQTEADLNEKALLKVLSQYPFILYEVLRKETFDWHKELLGKLPVQNDDCFDIEKDYENFRSFKFLFRRAMFLDNYQVLEEDFLIKLLTWFVKIDKYFLARNIGKDKDKDLTDEEDKLCKFPIFVFANYAEMIQKNGWVAEKLNKQLDNDNLREYFNNKNHVYTMQFYRLLQIGLAVAANDFMDMIEKEHSDNWPCLYGEINEDTHRIKRFFRENEDTLVTNINKYNVVREIFDLPDNWYKNENKNIPFVNFLWIQQLLFADHKRFIDHKRKEDPIIKTDYQDKISKIMKKMEEFFPQNDVGSFFIVIDGQKNPYVLSDKHYVLSGFEKEYAIKNDTYNGLIKFIDGMYDRQGITYITINEFTKNNAGLWYDIYNDNIEIKFPLEKYKWLLLIRISKFEDGDSKKLGVLGFYSEYDFSAYKPENLMAKRLLMLLRHNLGTFIEDHHKNDEFAELMKQKERAKTYEDRFDKFNHSAKDFINKTEAVRKNGSEKALFAINQLVFGNVLIGNEFAQYLQQLNVKADYKAEGKTRSSAFTDEEKQYLDDFVSGLQELYFQREHGKKEHGEFPTFEISINGYDRVNTKVEFIYIKIILIELISNAIRVRQGEQGRIVINFGDDKIIYRSVTAENYKDNNKIDEINYRITEKYPKGGIGLFMINKIIKSVTGENIRVEFDAQSNEFIVIIPIN